MAKYIDREKLPQFKLYNFCLGDNAGFDIGHGNGVHIWQKQYEEGIENKIDYAEGEFNINVVANDLQALIGDPNLLAFMWSKYVLHATDKEGFMDRVMCLTSLFLHVIFQDQSVAGRWESRIVTQIKHLREMEKPKRSALCYALAMIDEVSSFAVYLYPAQGFPLPFADGEQYYPKIVLIEDKIYKKTKGLKDLTLDFDFLKKSLGQTTYTITINGESAERKMVFVLHNAGNVIQFAMMDPNNGLSLFYLHRGDSNTAIDAFTEYNLENARNLTLPSFPENTAVITASAWNCHPRGEYGCNGNQTSYCAYFNGQHNCKHRSLEIVATITYLMQEYFKKNERKEEKNNTLSVSDDNHTKPYIPNGMIKLYDIKMSKEEKIRASKFTSFKSSGYISTEKAPHVRKGCMRYNPKTGQKDIKVSGSIIHKDKYEGFSTADRITV